MGRICQSCNDTVEALFSAVEGMPECDDANEASYLDVEPLTGITMGAHQAFLLSTQLEPYDEVDPAMEPAVVPILEVDVEGHVTDALADKVKRHSRARDRKAGIGSAESGEGSQELA